MFKFSFISLLVLVAASVGHWLSGLQAGSLALGTTASLLAILIVSYAIVAPHARAAHAQDLILASFYGAGALLLSVLPLCLFSGSAYARLNPGMALVGVCTYCVAAALIVVFAVCAANVMNVKSVPWVPLFGLLALAVGLMFWLSSYLMAGVAAALYISLLIVSEKKPASVAS